MFEAFANFGSLAKVLEPSVPLNDRVLETAYELYLQAPQASSPMICLHELSRKTGSSLWECRNAIVAANKAGRFPNCSLSS
ncbi:hypothetical protein ACN4EK_14485 [Pantanalinema rosaneae CENA516]|uniref:hypothetical protein n=1 Tax=Pantanalinema rosaneae TaxID=1620701 RepID=UPI003D6F28B4